MLEDILSYINTLDTTWIYITLFFFAFIENVFPPSPSDVVVIVGASLIAHSSIGFIPVLFITSIGSALGFILMYYIGLLFGKKIIRSHKIKFINDEDLSKADLWFGKYGYYLILANRFLPGTRSVISFFTGVHKLNILKTFIFAAISAFAWNVLIIYLGMELGKNVELISEYLSTYSTWVLAITVVVVLVIGLRFLIKKKKQ